MIIKEIKIKNFRSYYGDENSFVFSDGLTLILGDNGDGKTTFFEALEWLFNTNAESGTLYTISEKRKAEMMIGDKDDVSVYISFEHDGDKSVEKSFTFEKTSETNFKVSSATYKGYESNGSEREPVNGKMLINRCYDAFIRNFSMFKGENDLNVFDNAESLKQLIDKFSEISKFDTFVKYAEKFEDNANKALKSELKNDDKISKEAASLDREIQEVSNAIQAKRKDIKEKEEALNFYNSKLSQLEESKESSEQYHDIKERLETKEAKRRKLQAQISLVNYNHSLLDKLWILCAFPPILNEFKKKCSALSKTKRQEEKEFDKEKAIKLGKLEAYEEIHKSLCNGSPSLPWYLPNQETMEEMIHDHICKVCGRPAEEGSEAYNFMVGKLQEYKEHIDNEAKEKEKKKIIEEESLFKHNNIEDLHHLSISLSGSRESEINEIPTLIQERLELVERFRGDVKVLDEEIKDIEDEKSRLLLQAGNVSESLLASKFQDIKGLFEQSKQAEVRLTELNGELNVLNIKMKDLKDRLEDLNPSSTQTKITKKVHYTLEMIYKAFQKAKEYNLKQFLGDLENRANNYLEELSASDFHGQIRLVSTTEETTGIRLFSSNNTEIKKPSGSQKTVMYISILFAISDFTKEKREEDYPLIFDAATSSFGDSKEEGFYNIIDKKIKKQCIIATKDFITKGQVRTNDIEKLSCSVYRIKKDNFDSSNLATIQTIIERIK